MTGHRRILFSNSPWLEVAVLGRQASRARAGTKPQSGVPRNSPDRSERCGERSQLGARNAARWHDLPTLDLTVARKDERPARNRRRIM